MVIAEQIKEKLRSFPDGMVLTIKDFHVGVEYEAALVKALSRLVAKGDLQKISKGKYYKPRKTIFGVLKPESTEIAKDFLENDGKLIGYITGTAAFASMGLTTQITSSIVIGSNKYRRPLKRGEYNISFLLQRNYITKNNISLLRILDAIRLIRKIPATTPNECVKRLGEIIEDLTKQQQKELCVLAEQYTPYVRALLGAMLEQSGIETYSLKSSLSGVSSYKLPISDEILLTKQNWNII